jgi:hypothetical protein
MSIEDKEQKIKILLSQIPVSSSFASVSITKQLVQLTEEIEQEKMKEKTQTALQETAKTPD